LLIIDPDASTRNLLRDALEHDGFEVDIATDPSAALKANYDVVVVDVRTELEPLLLGCPVHTEIVLLTCSERLADANAAVKSGAFDFVLRPFLVEDVSLTVACAAARRRGRTLDGVLFHVQKNHAFLS
jgi:two-component system, NtrC family, response regulator AtoC